LGIVLFCLGYSDQALAQSSAAIAEARRLTHPPSLAASLALGTVPLSLVGDNAALDERANQLLAVAAEQGFPYWRALGTIFRGWSKVKNSDVAEGISLLLSEAGRRGIVAAVRQILKRGVERKASEGLQFFNR
jgi:predicted ATPase